MGLAYVDTEASRFLNVEDTIMLRLALLFLVIAVIAGLLGFGGIASFSWEGAKILFFVFLVLAVISLLGGVFRGPVT